MLRREKSRFRRGPTFVVAKNRQQTFARRNRVEAKKKIVPAGI